MRLMSRNLVLTVLVTALLPVAGASRAWSMPGCWEQPQDEEQRVRHVTIGKSPCVLVSTRIRRGMLGISLVDITPELRAHYGAPADAGVLVAKVEEDGPAAEAGVRVGDILTAVDGEEVSSSREVARLVRPKREGDNAELAIYRDGSLHVVDATIAEAERSEVDLGEYFLEDCEDLEFDIDIDTNAIREAVDEAARHFQSPEWKARWGRIDELNEGDLEQKLKAMEKRLEELEEQLEKESTKKGASEI